MHLVTKCYQFINRHFQKILPLVYKKLLAFIQKFLVIIIQKSFIVLSKNSRGLKNRLVVIQKFPHRLNSCYMLLNNHFSYFVSVFHINIIFICPFFFALYLFLAYLINYSYLCYTLYCLIF